MTDELARHTENPLLIFISSRQDNELSHARELAISAVNTYPGMKVWAFEDAPASSEAARDRYIRNAERADIVIWLIGSTTTPPVVEEVNACMRSHGKLLAFKLPAYKRDATTEALIKDVQDYATWKQVRNVDDLPEHIRTSLRDEMLRGYRDPAPVSHDLFLEQKRRESIADTKQLWTTLGVPDDIASELAEDREVGDKLTLPTEGMLTVNARQGSGKTLAAQRPYQRALTNRIEDHSQPFPMFLNARIISGELIDQIEERSRGQVNIYTQKVLVIIDGLDETGRHKANQLLGQTQSYTDAYRNAVVVLMTRPLPGLTPAREPFLLPECGKEELLSIASKIAGREVNRFEIPFREHQSRLPLFAVMVGAYLRRSMPMRGRTPSQLVNHMVRQILDESGDYPDSTGELLKRLAVASIASGEGVQIAEVAVKESEQALMANSRIVVEESGKYDFTLAIFREWFAARALVERSASLDDIDLDSDRWVVPLAIAINSVNSNVGPEIMKKLASRDPGMAGLVLKESEHSWLAREFTQTELTGTAVEIGTGIRKAMENWKESLGPLMSTLDMLDRSGDVRTLGIDVQRPGYVTTSWYEGDDIRAPVVQLPENPFHHPEISAWEWPSLSGRGVEPTRVWPWSVSRDELYERLARKLSTRQLALDSPEGFHEFVHDFAGQLRGSRFGTEGPQTSTDVIDCIDEWLRYMGGDPRGSITFSGSECSFTVSELESFRERILEASRNGTNILDNPWPSPDREWPVEGTWFGRYTDEGLLRYTDAIFNGALRIYNDMLERWFSAFNKRHQMRHALPCRLMGQIHLLEGRGMGGRSMAVITIWNEWAHGIEDSGAFIEMGSRDKTIDDATQERVRATQEEFIKRGLSYSYGWSILPGHEPRPATELAHRWLKDDLRALNWTGL